MAGGFRFGAMSVGAPPTWDRWCPWRTVVAVAVAGLLLAAGGAELTKVRNEGIARTRHA